MSVFSGCYTAIITPWTDDGSRIDFEAFRSLIERQITSGVDGIIPAGTTGESATLSHPEHDELIAKTVEFVHGRCKVIAGAGSNNTLESIRLAKSAEKSGADGILVITPYYNRPTPEGLYRHFLEVASNCSLPIMMYNVPSRTGTNMLPDTVARIRKNCSSVVSIKEASGSLEQASQILSSCDIEVMSGDDSLTLPLMAVGAQGVVSVVSNVAPSLMKGLAAAIASGDLAQSRKRHLELFPLMKGLFVETNPIPAKRALQWMGFGNGVLRLPLVPLSKEKEASLKVILSNLALIS